ncbi:MAG: NAD-dependent DNA ligase LigA [Deltaproteobacteria bacterium]|nr:NAD-dependent DNA ligase LigA [Deltaproteobacteria bacterium]
MSRRSSRDSVEELEEKIRHHNRLYFEKNAPVISDPDFDSLVRKLKKIRPGSPVLSEIPADFSVQEKEFKKVTHLSPMLSLDKGYSEQEVLEWAGKFDGDLIASPKIDGCATELRYNEKGELFLAATRGDGMVGEEITPNARMILDIPQKISPFRGGLEIRGEIYMRLSVFEKYKKEFANPRNLAAGAIKQKNPRKTSQYSLSFFGYDVLGTPFETEAEKIRLLKLFRFPTVEMRGVVKTKIQEMFDYFLSKRATLDYETDGVVFKVNRIDEQKRLGFTAHHPRFAIAYKFQGDSGITTLEEVEWSVARSGTITPVGVVRPVELSGAMVSRVSLHNYGLMKALGLRRGSKVLMTRRGGVIPKLESVVEAGRGGPFMPPKRCPSCSLATEVRDDFLYCTNPKGCRKTKMEELEHFIKVIECDGFGEKLIVQLYDNGFVKDPSDFFHLKKEDLLELERMGDVLATKLIGNIQARRELPLDLFLRSLGIRELAKHTSKILVREFKTLDCILAVTEEELSAIHTIGPVIAREVVEGLKLRKGLLERLLKYVNVRAPLAAPKEGVQSAGSLQNKKFLFTGSLLSMERPKAEKLVERLGGEIASGVTKDLDYLVVGDGGGAGSKLEK